MTRRVILATGGAGAGGGPTPPDPTLTVERGVTQVTGLNQNRGTVPTGGMTYRSEYRAAADFATLTFAWGTHTQEVVGEWSATAAYESPTGALTPLTFGGSPTLTLSDETSAEADEITAVVGEGELFYLRVYCVAGELTPQGGSGRASTHMSGNHLTGTWTPAGDVQPPGPVPVAVIGRTRPSVVCPAMIGDSIAALGIDAGGWWRLALEETGRMPGLSYGRNARNFLSEDDREGETLRAATHALVQYGANDFAGSFGTDFDGKWLQAVDYYAYLDAQNPGIPIYQTTSTPTVSTTDECATLGGQTLTSTTRQAWNTWLRNGAPIDPTTKAVRAVGSTGTTIRTGQTGHPLTGVVDVAAAVEQGGSSSPTGKWRVDLGPLGGDGVHPSNLGMSVMVGPVATWLATLT